MFHQIAKLIVLEADPIGNLNKLSYSMAQSSSDRLVISSDSEEILRNRRFMTRLTTAHHLSVS
jgi:predicted alpha/beta-hydrolase family hydrolase